VRRRFFVSGFAGGRAELRDDAAHHLARVLRAEPGQQYELSDGGEVWLGEVTATAKNRVEFRLLSRLPARPPRLHTRLLLSIVKFDRFEWALEKATELGVDQVAPLAAARSERKLVAAAEKRAVRWRSILLESAQQSRRLRPPELLAAAGPETWFAASRAQTGVAILLSEQPDAQPLREALRGPRDEGCKTEELTAGRPLGAALAIGPEGGWTEQELQQARHAGFKEASLGSTILRTETAVIAALAAINYALGE